jgi:hypothetical protein
MSSRVLYLLFFLLTLSACSSTKKAQQTVIENPRPEWVQSKPFNSTYYYGIGNVNTRINISDYQQIAKNKALEDLASEIEVTIDAQSVLHQKETNIAFIENYEATTRVDVQNNLSDYEVVDSWNNENEYWILYRLSKEEYRRIETAKRLNAINKALHYLDLSEKELNYKLRLDYLIQALEAIKPYLNDPLKTERNSQEIYLGNYALSQLNDHLVYLKLKKGSDELTLNYDNCFSKDVSFALLYNDIPVDNIPVRVKYNSYSDQKIISDNNGLIRYKIRSDFYSETPPMIEAWIKTSDLVRDRMLATLYESEYSPVSIKVSVEKPRLFISSDYGRGTFQEMIEKAGAKLSPDSSDVDLFLDASFKLETVGKTDDFNTSSCTILIKVFTNEGLLVEEKTWPSAKGVHTNQLSANGKAIENAIKQIKYSWIQKLVMEHCQ